MKARIVRGTVDESTIEDMTEDVDLNNRSTEMLKSRFMAMYTRGKNGAPVESMPHLFPCPRKQ